MSSGAQVDLDWAGTDVAAGGAGDSAADASAAGAVGVGAGSGAGARDAADGSHYLTDEEILGIDPPSPKDGYGGLGRSGDTGQSGKSVSNTERGDNGESSALGHKGAQAEAYATEAGSDVLAAMPAWMAAAAADPKNGAEARALWLEHQEFRAAFASPVEARTFVQEARAVADEARAIKELLPGGVRDAVSLREATQSVERIDAALFSGDVKAQSEVVAEMARTNPAAFRSMFAEAARVLAGMDGGAWRQEAGGREAGSGNQYLHEDPAGQSQNSNSKSQNSNFKLQGQDRQSADGGRQPHNANQESQFAHHDSEGRNVAASQNRRQDAGATNSANHESRFTDHQSPVTSHQSPRFDPAAYAAFERATNDTVARDVRGSIGDTLSRVMPEGVADGAARRIGEDIFTEVHRALAADRSLSEQVAGVLRDRRFGSAEQQRVAALVAGRAKQLVPSVARRVIGEWTGTVLNTARSKAARQAAAASRVDIAAPGGSSDSMPLRAMSAREVNYASMSDEQILGM